MLINRRKLLVGLVGLVAAPAVVRAASLMPVRRPPLLWGPLIDWGETLQRDEIIDALRGGWVFQGSLGEYRGVVFREYVERDLFRPYAAKAVRPPVSHA